MLDAEWYESSKNIYVDKMRYRKFRIMAENSAKSDILNFKEKGQARFHEFIKDRLLPYSELSIWSPMKKIKLKTFPNWMEKNRIRVGDKVVKLREER